MIKNLPKNLVSRGVFRKYLRENDVKKLHLGCGNCILESWLNTDKDPIRNAFYLDVTKRFPFKDNTFDYVFSEHLIEHITYEKGLHFLEECFRILKPGGRIRISTPDLKFVIELYNDKKTKLQKDYIAWTKKRFLKEIEDGSDVFVINNFFKCWNHEFIYDVRSLMASMKKAGFTGLARFEVGISKDPNLAGLETHDIEIGKRFNELESIVFEGVKPTKS